MVGLDQAKELLWWFLRFFSIKVSFFSIKKSHEKSSVGIFNMLHPCTTLLPRKFWKKTYFLGLPRFIYLCPGFDPTNRFTTFCGSESADRNFWSTYDLRIAGFWGSENVNGLVGTAGWQQDPYQWRGDHARRKWEQRNQYKARRQQPRCPHKRKKNLLCFPNVASSNA